MKKYIATGTIRVGLPLDEGVLSVIFHPDQNHICVRPLKEKHSNKHAVFLGFIENSQDEDTSNANTKYPNAIACPIDETSGGVNLNWESSDNKYIQILTEVALKQCRVDVVITEDERELKLERINIPSQPS